MPSTVRTLVKVVHQNRLIQQTLPGHPIKRMEKFDYRTEGNLLNAYRGTIWMEVISAKLKINTMSEPECVYVMWYGDGMVLSCCCS